MEEKLKHIQCELIKMVYEEINHNAENVCAEELGEVIDMIKDISETLYYHSVVEAMENGKVTAIDSARMSTDNIVPANTLLH